MYTLYFADKVTIFTTEKQNGTGKTLHLPKGERITRDALLNRLADTDSLVITSPEAEEVFENLRSQFTAVEAAGGIVENPQGEWLLIFRNGRWDLPKGHLEKGEDLPTCAAREVSEECGIDFEKIQVERFICATNHFYFFRKTDRWEIKRTMWFKMRYDTPSDPKPQTEEGITEVKWMSRSEAIKAVEGSFRTIQDVMRKIK